MCENYPTIRVGRLAQAYHVTDSPKTDWPRKVATVSEAKVISDHLMKPETAAGFHDAFVAEIEAELEGQDFEWIEPDGVTYELTDEFDSRPRRVILEETTQQLGPIQLRTTTKTPQSAIVDFEEVALRFRNWEIVFCCCVTVCVSKTIFDQQTSDDSDTYSKLWSRAVLVRKNNARATNVSREEVADFITLARNLCEKASAALAPMYQETFNEALQSQFQIDLGNTIESASVGTDEPDFEELLSFLREGGEFDQAYKNRSARNLVQLGQALHIFEHANNDATAVLKVVKYDGDPEGYCGVFLCLETEQRVQFFGLAHLPLWLESKQSKIVIAAGRRWVQSSNHVSGKIIRKIARHY